MRNIIPLSVGGDWGESRGLRSRVDKMKLWLRPNHNVNIRMDAEPGVWLIRFQLLDTEGQYEDPVQEWGEEEEDGAVFGVTLRREPVLPSPDKLQPPTAFSFVQYHTVKVRRLKAATLERLVTHLLDPEHQEPDFIRVFLCTYRAFTSTSTLIELLFQRDDSISNLDNSVCPLSTLSPVIRLWLEEYEEDFHEAPQYQALRLLCAHLRHRLCYRRLAQTAEALLKRFQEQDCSRSVSQQNGESLQQEDGDQEDGDQEHRGETSTKEEDKYNFMDFSVREVAEQLTRLDAELFARVVPFHCLGCVWSQRDKKENRNLAPTVRATISQFNAVTNRVITSLLSPSSPSTSPSPSSPVSSSVSSLAFPYPSTAPSSPRCSRTSPAHRARIIEGWIAVAQECRQLKNFSSLRAILSALQSNSVYRLKKTWAAVSRESMNVFDHLCETFPDENCVLTSRGILVEDGTQPDGSATPCSVSRLSLSSGVVPYLGTYLTVLTMLDTALTDTVEGGLINFEKRRREFEILSQIRQLQASCSRYSLPVNPYISTWLQAHTQLTDQESYELSRDLEPPVDPCPSSPNSWSSRLITKKLAALRTSSDNSLRKTHADQISLSSSGSSGSDMEDLSAPTPSPIRLKLKSPSGSLHNVAEDYYSSSTSSSSPSLSISSSSSHSDLSSSSLVLNPESPGPSSSCSSPSPQPIYNKQVADSCIIRVSVESVSNGNVYKSILLTSQDHTRQVIERALEKHNMEDVGCHNFHLCQMLSNGKDLQIPDKANVFYAMCTSANYDFVLRLRWRNHGRHLGSSSSPGAQPKTRTCK